MTTTGGSDEATGVRVRGAVALSPRAALFSKPVIAILTLLGAGTLTHFVPGLERFRFFELPAAPAAAPRGVAPPKLEVGEAALEMESTSQAHLAQPENVKMPSQARGPIAKKRGAPPPPIDIEKPPVPIEDASGKALDGFYEALAHTARKQPGAITRIVHFGDSIVTSDYVSGTLRRKFQREFGDAGHGFMLLANAWPAYFHNDVYRFASKGWLVSRIVGPLTPDGLYGLGGVSFRAPPGSRARFGTSKTGKYGKYVSKFVIAYVEQPDGGLLKINLDGKNHAELDTSGPTKVVKYREIRVPDGEHELELVTVKGYSRGFGVVLERDGPGVVYDAIGIQGARVRFLDKQDDEHWAEQLAWRKPNLLVYQFGANESGDGFAYPMDDYYKTMVDILEQGRRALPEAGCLVLSAMDRAEKKGAALVTMHVIPAIVAEQKKASAKVGCAFWNTYEAMGGGGSMATWVERGLGQADLTHPTGSGSEVLARWVFQALVSGFNDYQKRIGTP